MNDTICAISTALGTGAISIIRLSGKEAIEIANKIFKGKNLTKCESHTIHYGFIVDKSEYIDEALVTVMKAPKTFTMENIVEINCHGGIATTNRILELLLINGARLAESGEFTKRAFLNGRIDLVEAEGIEDIITAKSENERKLAINQIKGNLSKIIKDLKNKILELSANIEVNIDYPEYEDELIITNELLNTRLNEIMKSLNNILKAASNGKIIKEGINVAILGRPNVGKSSILNKLLDEEKAIVTDIAGTTRDIVEGQILIEGIKFNIIDTAGIRKTNDKVEKIGVEKSLNQIKKSDLIIYVLANDAAINKSDLDVLKSLEGKNYITFLNKSDLPSNIDPKQLTNIVKGSTVEEDGLENLKNKIIEIFNLDQIETSDFTYLSNARHIALIKQAIKSCSDALEQTKNGTPIDVIAIDIESCRNALSEILGETYKEELLDELFSKFCLGK